MPALEQDRYRSGREIMIRLDWVWVIRLHRHLSGSSLVHTHPLAIIFSHKTDAGRPGDWECFLYQGPASQWFTFFQGRRPSDWSPLERSLGAERPWVLVSRDWCPPGGMDFLLVSQISQPCKIIWGRLARQLARSDLGFSPKRLGGVSYELDAVALRLPSTVWVIVQGVQGDLSVQTLAAFFLAIFLLSKSIIQHNPTWSP